MGVMRRRPIHSRTSRAQATKTPSVATRSGVRALPGTELGNMDHGGEDARPTTVEPTDLDVAGAVEGGEAHMSTGTFHGQLAAAAARRAGFQPSVAAYHNSTVFTRHVRWVPVPVFHREPGPGVAYANIGVFWRQPGPVGVVLVGLQLPDGVMPVHDNYYGYSALQHRPAARLGVVLAHLHPGGGAVYSGDYALQPRQGAGYGEVLGDLISVPDGAGHGEVFVGLLPGGVDAYDTYGYHPWQPRPGAGRGEVFIGPLPDGVREVFDGLGNFAQQTLPATGRADGIAGALRDANFGAGYDGSGALAPGYNRGMAAEHLRRLFAFVGIGASSVAVNGLAAGPGSLAVAFYLFALLLSGLFLVILHVHRM